MTYDDMLVLAQALHQSVFSHSPNMTNPLVRLERIISVAESGLEAAKQHGAEDPVCMNLGFVYAVILPELLRVKQGLPPF